MNPYSRILLIFLGNFCAFSSFEIQKYLLNNLNFSLITVDLKMLDQTTNLISRVLEKVRNQLISRDLNYKIDSFPINPSIS